MFTSWLFLQEKGEYIYIYNLGTFLRDANVMLTINAIFGSHAVLLIVGNLK